MKISNWSCLLLGLLLTTMVACNPLSEDDRNIEEAEPDPLTIPATAVSQLSTASPTINSPPPQPSPDPTSDTVLADWQQVGGPAAGLQVAIPANWVDLSGRLDISSATSQLGLAVLFLADSERTGNSLLAGKEISEGAFAVGLIADSDLPPGTPQANLEHLLEELATAVTPLGQVQPVAAMATSGTVMGASVEVAGDPMEFFAGDNKQLRTRILYFTSANAVVSPERYTRAVFLLSSPSTEWEAYAGVFARMVESIVIYQTPVSFTIQDGAANVMGKLQNQDLVNGNLNAGVKDIWIFNTGQARYATLTLEPEDSSLDLTLSVIGPSGQTITGIDSGYAGDTEIAADVLLIEIGRYVVEIGEFFEKPGPYSLSFVLSDEPLFSGGGRIELGQSIQSEIPADGQQLWAFDGAAGQFISVVLAPLNDSFDAILDIYGPDGRRLVALDEGFSGDAEVISGFELPVTGEYSILVRSFAGDGGTYTLSLDEGGEATQNFYEAGDLAYGDIKTETLQVLEAHTWYFEGKAGDEIAIEAVPLDEDLDLDIWLLDPNVERIAVADSVLAGETETLVRTLPSDGQYVVLVRDFFGEAGEYEIRLTATPATEPIYAGTLNYNETVAGTLTPGQASVWLFAAAGGDVIDINLAATDGESDLLLALQDPDGRTVLNVDAGLSGEPESVDAFVVPTAGNWGIVVKEFFDEGGAYELALERSP